MKGRRKFTVVLLPEEGDVYSVVCPALPGCVSQGDGLEGALVNIQEAIDGILKLRRDKGLPLPTETPDIVADEIALCYTSEPTKVFRSGWRRMK